MPNNKPTRSELLGWFEYNQTNGVFYWKQGYWKMKAGDAAGGIDKALGYVKIKVPFRGRYYAHQLAWVIAYGVWPTLQIDHINRNRADNRISNLREASPCENQRNSKIPRNNTSGVSGVYWSRARKKWHTQIKVNNQTIYLGLFEDKADAAKVRREAEQKLFGGFAPNHSLEVS